MMDMWCMRSTFIKFKTTLSRLHSNIYYMGLVGLLMNFSATMIYTTVLIFVGGKDNILSENSVIIVRNLAEALANFLKIISGYISDRLQNRKTFLLVGYGAMLITKTGFILLTLRSLFPIPFLQVLYVVNQFVDRGMNSLRDPARDAVVMEFSTKDTRGVAFGVRKFITSSGSIISGTMTSVVIYLWHNGYMTDMELYKWILLPFIAVMVLIISYIVRKTIIPILFTLVCVAIGFLVGKIHFSSILYLMSILPVILTVTLIKIKIRDVKKINGQKEIINLKLIKDYLPQMKGIFILLGIMCFLTLGKINEFCAFSRGMELGMSKYSVPFMFTVMYIVVTFSSTAFGALVDRKKHFLTLLILSLCLMGGNIALYFAKGYVLFWIGLLLFSAFVGASDSAIASIITFLIPNPNIKATVYGLFYGLSGFLAILNAILVNLLKNRYGLKFVYLLSVPCIIVGIILLLCCHSTFACHQSDEKNIELID